ncbi:MAG: hypothetical protein ACR2JW_15650 [Thermomicrobiales bacterium]
MVQILIVANGTTLLRGGILALHAAGYRVTMYDVANMRDLHRAAPDLLVLAMDTSARAHTLLAAIRADASLHALPVIVVGELWEAFGPLPVALLAETIVLPAPVDDLTLRDAIRMYVPTLVRARRPMHHGHAVA